MKRRTVRGQNAIGALLSALALLILAGLSAAALFLRAPPVDPETLCRTDAPLAAHTIVLVDSTDRLEPRHRRKMRAVLAQERARLTQFDRLTVVRLNARRPQEPVRLFSRCLPRRPDQSNPLFENTRMTQERWDNDFQAILDAATRSAQSGGSANASPILASLRAVAADPDFGPEVPVRRLVLISDLLEHAPGAFTLYDPLAEYSVWRTTSPVGPPDLSGVELRIAPLDRPDHAARQAAALERFWPAYFEAAHVQSVRIDAAP